MGHVFVFLLIVIALSSLSVEAVERRRPRNPHHARTASFEYNVNSPNTQESVLGGARCEIPLPPEVKAPKNNIWDHLHSSQGEEVKKWLKKQPELNISGGYSDHKNYISTIQLMQPNKSDVR